jgi:hypothetical protein
VVVAGHRRELRRFNMARIISKESLLLEREARRAAAGKISSTTSYSTEGDIGGRGKSVEIPVGPTGEMRKLQLDKPVGEFLSSSDMFPELAEKVVVDVELGRNDVPLLYSPLYRTFVNANFPRLLEANQIVYANVVFLQHLEGQEVRFGSVATETGVTVPILTYSAGFEWGEDVEVYDEGWSIDIANEAVGRSYNALLNHLHLNPIISYTGYAADGNQSGALTPTGNEIEDIRATLRAALQDAAQNTDSLGRKKPIRPSYILCTTADAYKINDALAVGNRPSIGTVAGGGDIDVLLGRTTDTAGPNPSVNQLTNIIAYDGEDIEMGGMTWSYGGPTDGTVYLIQPQRNLFEFVKHDLRVDTQRPADLSRLVAAQMVARARRGLLMSPELSVWEVTLP